MNEEKRVIDAYEMAKERYSRLKVDTDRVIEELGKFCISLHCWQGDDVGGFEAGGGKLTGGGIQATGKYPGRARTIEELRMDLDRAFSLIPGKHRLNLHASYGEFGEKVVDRDEIELKHFQGWLDWAAERGLKLDFNSTFFSHQKADSGYTLSSMDKGIRRFWVEHAKRCRAIAAGIGKKQKSPCIHNLWIPDGSKDITVNRIIYRSNLKESLEEIFSIKYPPDELKDSLEGKLFGIGSEAFVAGSHEFYLLYALTKGKMVCLDMGHYHPTESVADKISSLLLFFDEVMLHISRGIRWDSDHVVILNDDVKEVAEEIARCNAFGRVHFALDYFDASLNRVGAWVIGARATLKAIMLAMLAPHGVLKKYEESGNFFARLALLESLKSMPFSSIWDFFCLKMGVPFEERYMDEIMVYEKEVLKKRA